MSSSKRKPGRFFLAPNRYDLREYMLNPALGDAEVNSRHERTIAAERLDDRLDNWALVPLGLAVAAGFTAVALAGGYDSSWLPAGIATGAFAVMLTAFIAMVSASGRIRKQFERESRAWIDAGEAVRIDTLNQFTQAEVSDEALWEAATLVRDARITDRRIRWAREARADSRLATGAHTALTDVEGIAQQMFQRAADLLDPAGGVTSEWLRERARS